MNRIVGSFGSLTRTVTPATYTVSGTVTVSGVALSGVTITSVALGNTTTDGSGNYSYTLVPIGTAYTITPTKTGYTFSAAATGTVTGTTTANFTATLNTYTISGTILVSAVALSGVTITSVALGNTATDGSGNYSYANVPHGTAYTITPSKTGYTFSPTSTSGTATAAATVSFAGTASTFSPGTYGTAVAFWDFTTAANALKSGGTSAANNEKIDQISDTIGTFHFKQTTDANRPTLKTAILNGFQVADFASASSNFMAMQNQTTFRKNYAALSMLFIVKPGTGAFTSQNCLFTSWNNAFNEGTRIYFNATTLLSSSGKRVDTDTSTLKSTPTSTFAVGTWYAILVVQDPVAQTANVYVNGVQKIVTPTGAFATSGNFENLTCPGANLGCLMSGATWFLNAQIAQVAAWSTALTQSDATNIYSVLQSQFGI